MNNELKIMLNR